MGLSLFCSMVCQLMWVRQYDRLHAAFYPAPVPLAASLCPLIFIFRFSFSIQENQRQESQRLTCSTKIQKRVSAASSPSFPNRRRAASTSFRSSRTAYSSVVRVSSTSSTIKIFLPTRLRISSELRSNHCVRVTRVPGASTTVSLSSSFCVVGSDSYSESPIA